MGAALGLRFGWAGLGLGVSPGVGGTASAGGLWVRVLGALSRVLLFPRELNVWYLPETLPSLVPSLLWILLLAAAFLWPLPASHDRVFTKDPLWRTRILGLGVFLVFLFPSLGFVPVLGAVTRDSHLYLPSLGWAMALGALLSVPSPGWGRRTAWALAILLSLLLGGKAVAESRVWRDREALAREMIRDAPGFHMGFGNLGYSRLNQGRWNEAEAAYGTALGLLPGEPDYAYGLGLSRLRMGDGAGAVRALEEAVRLRPGPWPARLDLAEALLLAGRAGEAVSLLEDALRKNPSSGRARGLLATARGKAVTRP